jgi:hypothetical protein
MLLVDVKSLVFRIHYSFTRTVETSYQAVACCSYHENRRGLKILVKNNVLIESKKNCKFRSQFLHEAFKLPLYFSV